MSELYIVRVGYGEIQVVMATDAEQALEQASATKFQEPTVLAKESDLKEQLDDPYIKRVFA